jgi:myosin heavy subunit
MLLGESGAGKTETTKKILQFISSVSGSTASRIGPSIENQILASNPLLESFGNAKTTMNDNSSRFGKYMEINFDKRFNIKGCNITAYLLEKSRVAKQGKNERNYHIFYMLIAGAGKDLRLSLGLKAVSEFNYLTQSGLITEVKNRSDLKEFEEFVEAMNGLRVDLVVQNELFQCLAVVLHLGNFEFKPHTAKGMEGGSK